MQLTNEKNGKKILTQKIYKIFLLIIYIYFHVKILLF